MCVSDSRVSEWVWVHQRSESPSVTPLTFTWWGSCAPRFFFRTKLLDQLGSKGKTEKPFSVYLKGGVVKNYACVKCCSLVICGWSVSEVVIYCKCWSFLLTFNASVVALCNNWVHFIFIFLTKQELPMQIWRQVMRIICNYNACLKCFMLSSSFELPPRP